MTIEEQIKQEILYRYKSIREFSNAINIPYTTVDSIFKRGLLNSGVGNVVKILSFLDLDIESTLNGMLIYKNDCEKDSSDISKNNQLNSQMSLSSRINQLRKEKGMSIDELSIISGVPKGTLSKITAGITTSPTLDTVKAIAGALKCKLDDLDDDNIEEVENNPKIQNINITNRDLYKIIEENYSATTRDAFNMYTKLDTNDQAEIRGEMKHMLRAEKYSDQDDTLQNA